MATQLILTVGTNPLPVYVAWHHLKDNVKGPIEVRFMYTDGTKDEKDRLEKYFTGCDPAVSFGREIKTSAGSLKNVRDQVSLGLEGLEDVEVIHVHYTGGTKVMGVEAVSTIESHIAAVDDDTTLQTSYLDPRSACGPAIRIRDQSRPLEEDTRKNVSLGLDEIAFLNGFKIAPFTHRYEDRDGETHEEPCDKPEEIDCGHERLEAGKAAVNGPRPIEWQLLEYGAYYAVKTALKAINESSGGRRDNFRVFRGVNVRRNRRNNEWIKHFELDVVAVLGYQVIVISCTVSGEHATVKMKGMEAILRARQLAGEEARAIVLCGCGNKAERLIQMELEDETGSSDVPLQVWGMNRWRSFDIFSQHFKRYFENDSALEVTLSWQMHEKAGDASWLWGRSVFSGTSFRAIG